MTADNLAERKIGRTQGTMPVLVPRLLCSAFVL